MRNCRPRLIDGAAVVLLALVAIAHGQETTSAASLEKTSDLLWRTPKSCGVNAVYILLQLKGGQASYADVRSRVPVDDEGSSLADLRDAVNDFGFRAELSRMNERSLAECPLPFIAHFEQGKRSGHFVVVTAVGNGFLECIDGTAATTDIIPRAAFLSKWSGYVLIARAKPPWVWMSVPLLVLAALSMVVGLGNGKSLWAFVMSCPLFAKSLQKPSVS
jgi:hypothetical protein